MSSKGGGGKRKLGRNKKYCELYKSTRRREKNKALKQERHRKRVEKKRQRLERRAKRLAA